MFGGKDPYARLAEFRHSLLVASRVYPNPEFEPLMNQASDADLEWLIVRIDQSLPEANTMTIGIMAVMARQEREVISTRTKAALQAAKTRGKVLGGHREGSADIASYSRLATAKRKAKADAFARDMKESLDLLKAEGLTLQQMAEALNMGGLKTQRRCAWTASAVRQVVLRLS